MLGRLWICCLAGTLAAPLSAQVTSRADLQFGTVITGTTTSIAPTAPEAASWRVRFTVAGFASMQLTLPTSLVGIDNPGTMPVSFCSTCARYRWNNDNPVGFGAVTFNPSQSVSLGLVGLLSNIYIWLGGAVSPPPSQGPGRYSGTVILTVAGLVL